MTYRELYVRVNEFAALLRDFCGLKSRGSRHHPYADGARVAGHHAGMRAAGSDSLGGVRRIQRRGLRNARRPIPAAGADHHGRLLPQRQDDRPQSRRRHCARCGEAKKGTRSTKFWCGDDIRAECFRFAIRERPRLFCRRDPDELRGADLWLLSPWMRKPRCF